MLYHTTALIKPKQILRDGLSPGEMTLAEQVLRAEEAIAEEEEAETCSVGAQDSLDMTLGRPSAVYFWRHLNQAYESMKGMIDLGLELIVIVINPLQLSCDCTISDVLATDELYDMYYHACIGEVMVDTEREEKLIDQWESSLEAYNPMKDYPYYCEVACPCTISPKAIRAVYTRNRKKMDTLRWSTERKITEW